MPSVSKKQHNFMAAVANNPKFAKKVGVSKSVGEDYMKADKSRKFKEGGLKETDSESNPGLAKLPTEVRNKMGYMKKGGMTKMRKYAEGGEMDENPYASSRSKKTPKLPSEDIEEKYENPVTKKAKDVVSSFGRGMMGGAGAISSAAKAAAMQARGMKKGGMAHSDIKKDKPMMKKVAASAVKGHEKRLHGMAKGGGVEIKGKTKGTMIKMKKGGAC
jgi:hypothetical protein